MNKFCVVGRLTKDPELKELENGNKVSNITVAIDRDYKDKEGNKITDFLHYSLWNKDAERLVSLSKKGALIQLEGYSTSKEIETKEGKIYVTQPIVDFYKHLENVKRNDNEVEESIEVEDKKGKNAKSK